MMWYEMCDRLHISRSNFERLRYENDEIIKFNIYTRRMIDDQEIYDSERQRNKYGKRVIDIYA